MADVAESIAKLSDLADQLDNASRLLAKVERDLEPIEDEYQAFVDNFEIGLWKKHEDEGAKLPPAGLRLSLAHRAMDPALLGQYVGLMNARKRGDKRVSALKAAADAQRSILSALKVEMEATR